MMEKELSGSLTVSMHSSNSIYRVRSRTVLLCVFEMFQDIVEKFIFLGNRCILIFLFLSNFKTAFDHLVMIECLETEKFRDVLMCMISGDDRNITQVYIAGERIL